MTPKIMNCERMALKERVVLLKTGLVQRIQEFKIKTSNDGFCVLKYPVDFIWNLQKTSLFLFFSVHCKTGHAWCVSGLAVNREKKKKENMEEK